MLENNLVVIFGLLAVIYCMTWFFQSYTNKLKEAYKNTLEIEERRRLITEQHFESLLEDKREESKRRKNAERLLREAVIEVDNLELAFEEYRQNQPPMDAEASYMALNQCRGLLEAIGRIGEAGTNLWRDHAIRSYANCSILYLDRVADKLIPMIKQVAPENYDEERVNKVKKILSEISNKIVEETSIIPAMVDEMFTMADDYFKMRETYIISGGTEPYAKLDDEYLDGTALFKQVEHIIKPFGLSPAETDVMIKHTVNLLSFPLFDLMNKINHQYAEPMLNATGYVVSEISDEEGSFYVNFLIPCLSRLSLERSCKPDTSSYLK